MISILLARILLAFALNHRDYGGNGRKKGKLEKVNKKFLGDDGGLDQGEPRDVGRDSHFLKFY